MGGNTVLIIGGTGSGKSLIGISLAERIIPAFAEKDVKIQFVNSDGFYRCLDAVKAIQNYRISRGKHINWDSPTLFAYEVLDELIEKLLAGESKRYPIYTKEPGDLSFRSFVNYEPADLIIVEGFIPHLPLEATGCYQKKGVAIQHSGDFLNFNRGDEVLPKEERERIYTNFFGANGYFTDNYFMVVAQQGIRLLRRLLRDYVELDRPFDFTLDAWEEIMKTQLSKIDPAREKVNGIIQNEYDFDPSSLYNAAIKVMCNAGIKIKAQYLPIQSQETHDLISHQVKLLNGSCNFPPLSDSSQAIYLEPIHSLRIQTLGMRQGSDFITMVIREYTKRAKLDMVKKNPKKYDTFVDDLLSVIKIHPLREILPSVEVIHSYVQI